MKKYKAFLSYSHADWRSAKKLHRLLEGFHVPRQLRQEGFAQHPCRPVFRDRDELGDAAALTPAIEEALAESAYLIVLCSPTSRKSQWVDREINVFLEHELSERIIAVTTGPLESVLPPALESAPEKQNIQIIDISSDGLGMVAGASHLVAALTGLEPRHVLGLQRQRQARTVALFGSAATVSVLATVTCLAMLALVGLGWMNALRASYASIGQTQRTVLYIKDFSQEDGPVSDLVSESLERVANRTQVLRSHPAFSILPGGEDYLDSLAASAYIARADVDLLRGDIDRQLDSARQARQFTDQVFSRDRSILTRTIMSTLVTPEDNAIDAGGLERLRLQAYQRLAAAEAANGQFDAAAASALAAFEIGEELIRSGWATDNDFMLTLNASVALAASETFKAETAADIEIALDAFDLRLQALPSEGATECCLGPSTWPEVRAAYSALALSQAISDALFLHEPDYAATLVLRGEAHLQALQRADTGPVQLALISIGIDAGWARVPASVEQLQIAIDRVDQSLEVLTQLSLAVGGRSTEQQTIAQAHMIKALLLARLGGEEFALDIATAKEILSALADSDGTKLQHRFRHSLLNYEIAEVYAAAGRCEAAESERLASVNSLSTLLEMRPDHYGWQRVLGHVTHVLECHSQY
ncbi:MAG: toll/interleukin-1 receptor domain-containing protein [Hyphomonadaceae bacterium]|nr:toll/interleukin-1 receptor domain-containing protein [Hyphomonadaceae bacterium]